MSDTPQSFSELQLAEPLLRAVAEKGYTQMSPIQAQAIPVILSGRDVMGAAQTGTGKTAAFTLPLLQRMLPHASASTSPARHPVRALVLAPTRELAVQVAQNVHDYAKYTQLRSAVVFGGMDMRPQVAELKKGVEVLVATPGRLLDHIEAKSCNLQQVEYVVLDEADRMLDIGFLPDLQRILSHLPKQRTTLLFSATFSPEIKKLAASYLQNPVLVEVARPNETAQTVTQQFFAVSGDEDKRTALLHLLRANNIEQAFVFVNSKIGCSRLARSLEADGLKTAALHGDKTQDERLKSLEAFKSGAVQLLVATDVAARGLDIKDVPAVFNFDLPFHAEDYVHRIGRTGRAGANGLAISLVTPRDAKSVIEIEKITKQNIQAAALELSHAPRRERASSYSSESREPREAREFRPRRPESQRDAFRSRNDAQQGEKNPRNANRGGTYAPMARAPLDPFFTKPYESQPQESLAAWEKAPKSAIISPRSIVGNKPKRSLASLLNTKNNS